MRKVATKKVISIEKRKYDYYYFFTLLPYIHSLFLAKSYF